MRTTVSFLSLSSFPVFFLVEELGDKDAEESVWSGTCILNEEEDVEGTVGNDEFFHKAVIVTSHHVVLM